MACIFTPYAGVLSKQKSLAWILTLDDEGESENASRAIERLSHLGLSPYWDKNGLDLDEWQTDPEVDD